MNERLDEVKGLVTLRMRQAAEAIEDARALLDAGRGCRTAVNRAYYAGFYALLALLQTAGQVPRKHAGAITLFDREFVKTGLLPMECSSLIHTLFDTRLQDDYQRLDPVPIEEAQRALQMAEEFTVRVREYLVKKGFVSDAEE
jgi:uncharacterized protein (UPF0332 family)